MTLADLNDLVHGGESETVEFKKSTANLVHAAETLCGMLNARGGTVLIGVTDDGEIPGQQVSDKTLQEVAVLLGEFEPYAPVRVERIAVDQERDVLALIAQPSAGMAPFLFKGRPFARVGPTTSPMVLPLYERLIGERMHTTFRWEKAISEIDLSDLDHDEIVRTVQEGIAAGRLPSTTGLIVPDILDRFGIRIDGHLTHAAVVLFGREFLPHYPQ